ncbi:MAG: hypothetical protein QG549_291 [Patescibacteria group bacterium]|nr:hypothetical protein [Patescibacteria group bacterium]
MIDDTRVFSRQLALGLIGVGLVSSLLIFLLPANDAVRSHYSLLIVYFTYFSTIIAIPLFMLLATKYQTFKLPAMVLYQATMGIMLLYFTEPYSPFTPLWSLLILFASIYYGWAGFILSGLALYVVSTAYVVMFQVGVDGNLGLYALLSAVVVTLTMFTSYIFVQIIMSNRAKNIELDKARKSEKLQVNRLNTLINSINDAVITLNRYGRITSQNASAQAFFDTNQSLVGREIDTFFELKDTNEKDISVHNLINDTKASLVRDDLMVSVNGDERHISMQLARIRSTFDDDEEYGFVVIIRDITKQKTLEQEKDEFISVTSHELRTPVTIAEGSLSNLLLMYERNANEAKLKSAAEEAYDQIIYLAKMINDLSTLSRAERGVGDTLEALNITELLHELYIRYTPEAKAKALEFNLDVQTDMPMLKTSRLYLEEILQNFITNAIKYTKEGTVTLGAKMQDDNSVIRFTVTDTGIGMSKTDQERIFEKFYRSEDYRTRETSGTGLGLYVVSKLANKLGTKIDVESRLNHGSTFGFELKI